VNNEKYIFNYNTSHNKSDLRQAFKSAWLNPGVFCTLIAEDWDYLRDLLYPLQISVG